MLTVSPKCLIQVQNLGKSAGGGELAGSTLSGWDTWRSGLRYKQGLANRLRRSVKLDQVS